MTKAKSVSDIRSDSVRWQRGGRAARAAGDVAGCAGTARAEGAAEQWSQAGAFETLEKRELLFALSLDPTYTLPLSTGLGAFVSSGGQGLVGSPQSTFLNDPANPLRGSTYSRFGYVLPFFQTQIPTSIVANAATETFQNLPEGFTAPLQLPDTFRFPDTGLTVTSLNVNQEDPTSLERRAVAVTNPPTPTMSDTNPIKNLLLQLTGANQIEITVTDEENPTIPQFMKSFSFRIDLRAQTEPPAVPGGPPGQFTSGPVGSLGPVGPGSTIHSLPPTAPGGFNPTTIAGYDLDDSIVGTRVTLFKGTRAIETFAATFTGDDPTTSVVESPMTRPRSPDSGVLKFPLGLLSPMAVGPTYNFFPSDGKTVFDKVVIERINPTPGQRIVVAGSPSGGQFVLGAAGQVTAPLGLGTTAAQLQAALEGLSTIGAGNVVVVGPNGGPWQVSYFNGAAAVDSAGDTFPEPGAQVVAPPDFDQILIIDATPQLQTGRFAQTVGNRIFGAQVGLGGTIGGTLDATRGVYVSQEENFTAVAAGPVALGTPLPSRLRISQTVAAPASGAAVVAGGGGAGNQLTFTNNQGTSLQLSFLDERGNARPLRNFTFTAPAAGPGSLTGGQDIISLFRNGRVVRTYGAADLALGGAAAVVQNAGGGRFRYVLDTVRLGSQVIEGIELFRNEAFDEVRISRATGTGSSGLAIDQISAFFPPMVEFFDLYGRPIAETLGLGVPAGRSPAPLVDQNDDGIPDFNDGIGRIVISNAREDTNFTIAGGTITYDGDLNGTQDPRPGGFLLNFAAQFAGGLFNQFEQNGFGHFVEPPQNNQDTQPRVYGLPDTGGGSVVIGSPFARDNRSTLAYLGASLGLNIITPIRSSVPASRGGSPGNILDVGINLFPPPMVPPAPVASLSPGSVDTRQELQFTRTFIENTLFDASGAPVLSNVTLGANPLFQGVFVADGQNVGTVVIDGALYGNSTFGGAVRSLTIGYLPGSVTINGDVGSLAVRASTGVWEDTFIRQQNPTSPVGTGNGPVFYTTNSRVLIARAAGQLDFGIVNLAAVDVLNDVNNPLYSGLDTTQYTEREVIQGPTSVNAIFTQGNQLDDGVLQYALLFGALFDPATDQFRFGGTGSTSTAQTRFPFTNNRTNFITGRVGSQAVGVTNPANQPGLTSQGTYRNDTILGGEFIGSTTGTVLLSGVLGGFGPQSTSEDVADVFGFSARVGAPVDFTIIYGGTFAGFFAAKVVDSRGRTLANYQHGSVTGQITPDSLIQPDIVQQRIDSARFTFTPDSTDAYYLVLSRLASGNEAGFMGYQATVTGLAPLSLGMYSQQGGLGPGALTVSGNVGLVRFAAGLNNVDGQLIVPPRNTGESDNDYLTTRRLQLTVNGSLGALIFGGAVDTSAPDELVSVVVSGDLGTLRTGTNLLAGQGPTAGDFAAGIISVGGSIAEVDINGALGARLNPFPDPTIATPPVGPVLIRAGTAGGRGDIGAVLVGTYVAADRVQIRTAQGGTVDRFIVGTQGPGSNALTGSIRLNQPSLLFTAGTRVRFADFTTVSSGSSGFPVDENNVLPLNFGQTQTFTDSSGTILDISIGGGTGGRGGSIGQIVALPIAGAGLLIGNITATLGAGAELRIGTRTPGTQVGLGRINLTSAARPGSLQIGGNTEIDVLRLDAGGTGLDQIVNRTRGGDVVSGDLAAVRVVSIAGNLGSTNTTEGMRRKIGHFLGLSQDAQATIGGSIGVPGLVANWDGTLYEGVDTVTVAIPTTGDQVGLPYDPFLNGIVVRAGNVQNVAAGGQVGDVILTGELATLTRLTANFDRRRVPGVFNGIVGSIYAQTITSIDVGDGLAGPGQSALAEAGIFANGAIINITAGSGLSNPIISGVIIAAGQGLVAARNQPGINGIYVIGGRIDGAFIGGATLDSFWRATRSTVVDSAIILDNPTATATVLSLIGIGTTMFRSTVLGTNIGTVNLVNGIYDASSIISRGVAGTLQRGTIQGVYAAEFRNSTVGGEAAEFIPSQIIASDEFRVLSAVRDISDLEITTPTNLIQLTGRHANRLTLNVGNIASVIQLRGDLRSSTLNTGRLDGLYVGGGLRASTVSATGPVNAITVIGDASNASIRALGAAARINSLAVYGSFSGDISSTNTISSIFAGRNLSGSVSVLSTSNGVINAIRAGGDLAVSISAPGNVNSISAGGNIGRRVAQGAATGRDVIDVAGNLTSVVAGGQVYADIRVGGSLNGVLQAGRTSALPGADFVSDFVITAAGRINAVSIIGDFRGSLLSLSGGIGSLTVSNGSLIGSARAANTVDARDGDIGAVTVVRGHILGSISARDGSINSVVVTADAAGFGNLGIDPGLSSAVGTGIPASEQRNQLPAGIMSTAGRDGPRIFAGRDINVISVGRSVFESSIQAGRRINSVSVVGNIDGTLAVALPAANASFIVAGDEINSVVASGTRAAGTVSARGTTIAAGILSLGTDNLPGGAGANADLVKSGIVNSVAFRHEAVGTAVYAGLEAGPNGVFEQGANDDTVAPGLSNINSVVITRPTPTSLVSTGNFAFAKTRIASVVAPAGSLTATQANPSTNPAITGLTTAAPRVTGNLEFVGDPVALGFTPIPAAGLPVVITGTAVTLRYAGLANQAFYDAVGTRIVLVNTTAGSLTIDGSAAGTLTGLTIQTARNSSLGALTIRPQLAGASNIYIDGSVSAATFGLVTLTPGNRLRAGESFGAVTIGARDTATVVNPTNLAALAANSFTAVTFLNGYGVSSNSRIDTRNLSTLTVTGTFNGVVSSEFDIAAVRVNGAFNGRVRSGGNVASLTATTATNARISARGNLGSVSISGAADGLAIYAGTDLGGDGDFGGTGTTILGTPNADTITNGNIASVVAGNTFTRSDIAAGRSRGVENFLNRAGDIVAGGRSDIGAVRIAGAVGSAQQTQSYGIFASGTVGSAVVQNFNLSGSLGNFTRKVSAETIRPLQVLNVTAENDAIFTWTSRIVFNQNINPGLNNAALLAALTIAEVRDGGQAAPIVLRGGLDFSTNTDADPANDVDFAVAYNPANFTATITYARAVTDRALVAPGAVAAASPGGRSGTLAGPGIYKVTVGAGLSGATVNSLLDGNGDGLAAPGETFSRNIQVGDAGDRAIDIRDSTVSLYGATDLNLLLNSDRAANNGSPDVNVPYTLRGRIGDSPSLSAGAFPSTSDFDVYAVSLRAGQIVRFGELSGTAQLATRAIYDSSFTTVAPAPGGNVSVLSQPLVSSSGLTIDSSRPLSGTPQRDILDFANLKVQRLVDPSDLRNASESFLIRQTGVYYIAVGSSITQQATPPANLPPTATSFSGLLNVGIFQPTVVSIGGTPGNQGDYAFNITIEDSGTGGFFGTNTPVDSAPGLATGTFLSPGAAGVPTLANFRAGNGADGLPNTADDTLFPFIERFDASLSDPDGTNDQSLAAAARPENLWVFRLVPDAGGLFGVQADGSIAGNVVGTNSRGVVAVRNPALSATPVTVRTAAAGALPTIGGVLAAPAAGLFTAPAPGAQASTPITIAVAVQVSGGAIGTVAVPGVAPAPSAFQFQRYAGPDAVFGNNDDYVVGSDAFDRLAGPDGALNTADDTLAPTGRVGSTVRINAGPDNLLGTADDVARITSDAGDGALLGSAPLPSQFFPTAAIPAARTVLPAIVRGEWTYTLESGFASGVYQGNGTAAVRSADRVVGINSRGVRTVTTAGADGRFNTTDDATLVESSLGLRGATGANTTAVAADLDVFHLANGATLAPGDRFRITLKAAQTGANLGALSPVRDQQGSFSSLRLTDSRGAVNIGLFDTTLNFDGSAGVPGAQDGGTNLFNSALVASAPIAGGYTGARVGNASNGITGYGTDANGDPFIDVVIPRALNPMAAAALAGNTGGTFALYVQGLARGDYAVEIVRQAAVAPASTARTQNFLIETGGGQVNWLEANPYTPTTLAGFDPSFNALVGDLGGVSAASYIIDAPALANPAGGVVQRLRALFGAASLPGFTTNTADATGSFGTIGTVRFSTNAADFEGQTYSTIYISSSAEPASMTTSQLSTLVFGASQGFDAFNTRSNDEAVIFTRAFNVLGNGAGTTGANLLTAEITAAAARRVAELLGLRFVSPDFAGEVLNTNSVLDAFLGVGAAGFSTSAATLSTQGLLTNASATPDTIRSTDFFLGQQRSASLLNRIFLGL